MVAKSVDKKGEIQGYIKARTLHGSSLKDIFSEIKVENAPTSGRPKRATAKEDVAKVKEMLKKGIRCLI